MSRFFVEKVYQVPGYLNLSQEESRHANNVLRLKPGDAITIFDSFSNEYDAEIVNYDNRVALIKVINKKNNILEQKVCITLFQGVPKFDKMDYIIQKCTEIGVSNFVPVITERTVVRFNDDSAMLKRIERWKRISLEALKQCGGNKPPSICMPVAFNDAVSMGKSQDLCIIPYEKESNNTLRKELAHKKEGTKNIGVFIGPEGGFSQKEIDIAVNNTVRPVTLGKRIFRTETAGLVVSSIICYEFGEI